MVNMSKGYGAEKGQDVNLREVSKVTAGAMIGSVIDWYDFFLSSLVAAVVWPSLYFGFLKGTAALAVSASTYIITYLTRPVGAFIFGEYGDKLGRKTTLVLTLLIGGIAIFGIAFTPGYGVLGVLAPSLIILFRLLFGVAMGGEYGGAQTWVTEFLGKSRRRGFWNGLVYSSNPVGILLSSLAFVVPFTVLGPKVFISYGWRYPFIAGGFLIIIGIIMRYKLEESPLFKKLRQSGNVAKRPSLDVFREFGWKMVPLCFLNAGPIAIALIELNGPYGIAIMRAAGLTLPQVFEVIIIASLVAIGVVIGSSTLSDYIGRKRTYLIGSAISVIVAYPAILLLKAGFPYTIAGALLSTLLFISNSVLAPLYTEQFPTKYRYSGSGISYQVSSAVGSIIGGIVPSYVIAGSHGLLAAIPSLGFLVVIASIISLVSGFPLKETFRSELRE